MAGVPGRAPQLEKPPTKLSLLLARHRRPHPSRRQEGSGRIHSPTGSKANGPNPAGPSTSLGPGAWLCQRPPGQPVWPTGRPPSGSPSCWLLTSVIFQALHGDDTAHLQVPLSAKLARRRGEQGRRHAQPGCSPHGAMAAVGTGGWAEPSTTMSFHMRCTPISQTTPAPVTRMGPRHILREASPAVRAPSVPRPHLPGLWPPLPSV